VLRANATQQQAKELAPCDLAWLDHTSPLQAVHMLETIIGQRRSSNDAAHLNTKASETTTPKIPKDHIRIG